MHDNDTAHEALEQSLQRFNNIAEGHVPQAEQTKALALGLAELTLAMMKINRQIHDVETLCEPPKKED